jgi:3D (Asp-Asp-Asp) domain-containing protein
MSAHKNMNYKDILKIYKEIIRKSLLFILVFIGLICIISFPFCIKEMVRAKKEITRVRMELGKENQELKETYGIFKSKLTHEDYLHCFDEVDMKNTSWFLRETSAYNVGDPNQCAGDSCISANGESICEALEKGYKRCACNFLPFGSVIEIEGWGECMITDRLNEKYEHRIDIAMKKDEKEKAIQWGVRNKRIKIISIAK